MRESTRRFDAGRLAKLFNLNVVGTGYALKAMMPYALSLVVTPRRMLRKE